MTKPADTVAEIQQKIAGEVVDWHKCYGDAPLPENLQLAFDLSDHIDTLTAQVEAAVEFRKVANKYGFDTANDMVDEIIRLRKLEGKDESV